MKMSTLLLTGVLALGVGLSGNAMAHGDRGYGWNDRGWKHEYRDHYRHHRHHRHDHYRHRAWRHDHDRRYSRRHDNDTWYGLHLFLGGH